ncbi:MAG TPA: hypothetical protein VIX84_02280 [Acidimicrobiales bacterium]
MSMYVAILSSALDDWVNDLSGKDLIEYALLCRQELRAVSSPRPGSAYTALAAEIAYDRALIALCTERGIDAHATSFVYPRAERQRIERVLRGEGVDLESWFPAPRNSTQWPSGVKAEGSTVALGDGTNLAEDGQATTYSPDDAKPEVAAASVETSEVPEAEVSDDDP